MPNDDEQCSDFQVGTRVVGEINVSCEKCEVCQFGSKEMKRNHCSQRTVLGILNRAGTFAEYLTLPLRNLLPVPSSVPDNIALFAEPLAAAFRIVEQIQTTPTDSIAVIGDGKLGNLITQVMILQPHSKITHFGKHKSKLDKVPGNKVERVLVDSKTGSIYKNKFNISIDATGSPTGLLMAAEVTKPLGTIVLKSTCASGIEEFNTSPFVVQEITIIGSRCGNFSMALHALESKEILVEQLIHNVYPFEEALDALEAAKVKGVMKIQLKM